MNIPKEYVSKLEDFADDLIRRSKNYLPTTARVLMTAPFFQEAFITVFNFESQTTYTGDWLKIGMLLAQIIRVMEIIVYFTAGSMILLKRRVTAACAMLILFCLFWISMEPFYMIKYVLFRRIATIGGLVLLIAEDYHEHQSLYAGVPSMGDRRKHPRHWMQLLGRISVLFMFVSIIRFELKIFGILRDAALSMLMILVAVGYRTKLSATCLIILLTIYNAYMLIWIFYKYQIFHDHLFIRLLSVIGGLLMIVYYGPGGISWDLRKKSL